MDEPLDPRGLETWLQRFQNLAANKGEFDAPAQMAERLGSLAGMWSGSLPFGAEPSGLDRLLRRSDRRP